MVVLSADHGAYAEALNGFEQVYGATSVLQARSSRPLPADTRVIVAFGGKAAARRYPENVVVIYALAPGVDLDPAGPPQAVRVSMVPRADALLSNLKSIQPSLHALAALYVGAHRRDYVSRLEREGAKRGVLVRGVAVDESGELADRLRALRGKVDALWLAPDPGLINPGNFAMVREFARSAGVPFYAPTSGLLDEGATACVAPSFAEVGATAARAAKMTLAGAALPGEIFVERVETVANGEAARLPGLSISKSVTRQNGVRP